MRKRTQFTYSGFTSTGCGLIVEKRPEPTYPQRAGSFVEVPGMDGSVFLDGGYWKPVTLTYQVACLNVDNNADALALLCSQIGYNKLVDNNETDVYRYAAISNVIKFQEEIKHFGRANIEFTALPYKMLTSGDSTTTIPINGNQLKLMNPTNYTALPIIRISTRANNDVTITVNSHTYHLKPSKALYIDSETMRCTTNKNGVGDDLTAEYASDDWPELVPGENLISVSGVTSSASIIPRWRKL